MKNKRVFILLVGLAAFASLEFAVGAVKENLNAVYLTPYGALRVKQNGAKIKGTLLNSSGTCPFLSGDTIFEGVVDDSNITGKMQVCRAGADPSCAGSVWAFTVAVVDEGGKKISGSAFANSGPCQSPGLVGGKGIVFFRHKQIEAKKKKDKKEETKIADNKPLAADKGAKEPPKESAKNDKAEQKKEQTVAQNNDPKTAPKNEATKDKTAEDKNKNAAVDGAADAKTETKVVKEEEKDKKTDFEYIGNLPDPGAYNPLMASNKSKTTDDQKVKKLLKQGEAYMSKGHAVEARKFFEKAHELDPLNAPALGGIGVTYYLVQDFEKALSYYRKAVAADANYGDGYYNMACVYAVKGNKGLALKYLKISVAQGFKGIEVAKEDDDLRSLREEPEFIALLNGDLGDDGKNAPLLQQYEEEEE